MPITLKNISYTYDQGSLNQKDALVDVSLLFEDHCYTALIGRTGSGKSTLIQHLNGLLLPDSGIIDINGQVIDMSLVYKTKKGKTVVDEKAMRKKHKRKIKEVKELRRRVGLVFQFPEYQLFETTVLEDVSYGPRNFGSSKEDAEKKAKEALSLVGIPEAYFSRSPFELSGGEKRRVAIAGILAMKPDVLVLDEPTVGLDCHGQESLLALLKKIYDSGTSIILSTHDMDVVLGHCNKAVVLEEGRIVSVSTPLELFSSGKYLEDSAIEPPKVFSFARSLIASGLAIDINRVKDCRSLAEEIVRAKGGQRR